MMTAEEKFYAALEQLNAEGGEGAKIIAAYVQGDPQIKMKANIDEEERILETKRLKKRWRPRIWNGPEYLDAQLNNYVTVSSFYPNRNDEYRRKGSQWAQLNVFVIDDVGTDEAIANGGAKISRKILEKLPPTALVETSPGNYQAWYFLEHPEKDVSRAVGLINGFIQVVLGGKDSGMAGVNRLVRVAPGVNGKDKYNVDGRQWQIKLHFFNEDRKFTVRDIADAFRIPMGLVRTSQTYETPSEEEKANRHQVFSVAISDLIISGSVKTVRTNMSEAHAIGKAIEQEDLQLLDKSGQYLMRMLEQASDADGWLEISCPFRSGGQLGDKMLEGHTGGADDGAAIRLPRDGLPPNLREGRVNGGNDNWGGWRCYHSHGLAGKGEHNGLSWRHILAYLISNGTLLPAYLNMLKNHESRIERDLNIFNDNAADTIEGLGTWMMKSS